MNFDLYIWLAYLLSAVLFILGLKQLSSPETARRGNRIAAVGMLLAVVATLLDRQIIDFSWILIGLVVGTLTGAIMARTVKMTAMPQMVAVFNGFGGAASGLVAAAEYLRHMGNPEPLAMDLGISIMAGTLIGGVTFSGSFVAFAKLQGFAEKAATYFLQKTSNFVLAAAAVAAAVYLVISPVEANGYLILAGLALVLGILVTIPIGGADMPVVVALLNSYSGLAASAAGFVLSNNALIISGALVGASGLILTNIMCRAMNRSLANVLFGAFGAGAVAGPAAGAEGEQIANPIDAEDCAMMLAYARSVVFVPGYGLAVAQAQHREDINPDIANVDVAVVVGANDVVNPAARDDPNSDIAGMPIVEVDKAHHCVVLKRSLNPGFAGIQNQLFFLPNTRMLFGSAEKSIADLVHEVKAL
ncbi:MAG: NAD(P)(+) transhydrogenase (Re/Si-specific) subunit beta [Gemmatimonadales bacterium]